MASLLVGYMTTAMRPPRASPSRKIHGASRDHYASAEARVKLEQARARLARDLFYEALDLGDEERAAFLAARCGGDAALASEVEQLFASWRGTSTAQLFPALASGVPAEVEAEVVVTPTVAGNFRLGRVLGRGGMGSVYEARHVVLGEPAAVKLLHPHLCADPYSVTRLLNEARAVNAIRHPHIVEVKDAGITDGGAPYIAMELLAGESLSQRLARLGRLPLAAAGAITLQVADALAAAHAAGAVHRDLKPENIFLCAPNDHVKVLDFGVAKLRGPLGNGAALTQGGVLGTPRYMAPEQWRNSELVDERTDIYALGLVLAEMSRGTAKAPQAALTRVIAKATAAEPDQRYASMHDFAAELRGALVSAGADDETPLRRLPRARFLWVATVAAALALVGLVGWRTRNHPRNHPTLPGGKVSAARDAVPADVGAAQELVRAPAPAVPSETRRAPRALSPDRVTPPAATRPSPPGPPAETGPKLPSFLHQNPY
jgi:hypothetical protein